MPIRIAINGTGRIGLCAIRVASQRKDVEIVAINSTAETETLLHLIRHDSVHGHFEAKLNADRTLNIGHSKNILVLSERDINKLDFSIANAEIIIECTGKFNSLEASSAHLKNSVKKVIISAPTQNTPTFVYGVNHKNYHNESVISNASCTTNASAPLLKILDEAFKVENSAFNHHSQLHQRSKPFRHQAQRHPPRQSGRALTSSPQAPREQSHFASLTAFRPIRSWALLLECLPLM